MGREVDDSIIVQVGLLNCRQRKGVAHHQELCGAPNAAATWRNSPAEFGNLSRVALAN